MTAQLIHGTTETLDDAAESRESSARAILGATLTLLALVGLWELLVRGFNIPGWLLPAPSAIAIALAEWRDELIRHSLVTLYETLLGFALSIAISIPLAVAVVHTAILRNTIYPILLTFQSVPKVAIAPCSYSGWDSARCRRLLSCSWSAFFQSSSRPQPGFRRCLRRSWS